MYKLLIIEDEYLISSLIKVFIARNFSDIEVIGTPENGRDALAQILEKQPDIVFADINLPLMNGLDVINAAQGAGARCHFVIITGYKDFDYAHRALQMHVDDYLLKPVDEAALCKMVREICAKVDADKNASQQNAADRRLLQVHFVKSLLLQRMPSSIEAVNEAYRLHFQNGSFLAISIGLSQAQAARVFFDLQQKNAIAKKIRAQLQDTIRGLCYDSFLLQQEEQCFCVLNFAAPRTADVRSAVFQMFCELLVQCDARHINLCLGLGTVVDAFDRLPETAIQSQIALLERNVFGSNRIIDFARDCAGRSLEPYAFSARELTDLSNAAYHSEPGALSAWVETVFHRYIERQQLNESDTIPIFRLVAQMMKVFFDVIQHENDADAAMQESMLEYYCTCSSIHEIQEELSKDLEKIRLDRLSERNSEKTNTAILLATGYIEQHLDEQLSLETLADMVFLSPSYFSELFKQQTGTNFREYVIQCRIREACALLKSSNMRINDVAAKVGYDDAKHFSKSFKKSVGITPKEYRQLYCR